MKRKLYSIFLTALLGMTGMQVWAQELTTTEIDGVTYYKINNGQDMQAFADIVNGGEFSANGLLSADINMDDVVWETPIGTSTGQFSGIFDGQGHKITGFDTTSEADGGGLFGFTNSATIKDFSISGFLTSTAGTGSGVVGYPSSSVIYNVHSALEIDVPEAGVHHVGGVVGSARGGNTISGCTFRGSMQVAAGSTDNFAGIVAYLGGDSVSFCANYGTITFDDINCSVGGVAGYCNNTASWVQNCLNMGKVVYSETEGEPNYGSAIVGRLRNHDDNKMTGNCWLEGTGTTGGMNDNKVPNLPSATCFTPDKLATGEVCYLLNGNQSTIGWYQTIGADEAPVLFDATHGQVYMNGRLHCNGDVYDGSTFSNENTGITQDDHNIVDGFCDYCGLFDPDYMTPNADGFYEIGTAKQLAWFEQKVNKGELDANAILTADIDFADLMPEGADPAETEVAWTPIGDWGNTRGVSNAGYKGHFDGQGHSIKNLNATSKQNYFGLFGVISTDCLIENFDIYGTYHTAFQYAGGVAAYARDDRPTIRNIHSFVDIYNTYAGGRQGGILGGVLTTTYKTVIENCTYSGTLDGNDAGNNGNYGGIVGYVNNNANTVADITNCLFDGAVVNLNAAPGGCTFGGFVGYSNGGAVTIKNCLSYGTVESAIYGQFFGAVKSTRSSLPNCYYIGDVINGTASTVTLTATETDMTQLAGGEITWKLNEETFIDVVWHQVLGEQNYPVPYGDQGVIYQTSNGSYECIDADPDSFLGFLNDIITKETEFLETVGPAYQELLSAYEAEIKSWEDIDNLEEFLEAYGASAELKESIQVSAANYALYVQACTDAAAYVEDNNLKGETTDILTAYLENNVEPNPEEYPNGSYPYIMENLNLDDEGIAAEILFVNQMLEAAVAADGILPGNEITRLLANPNFTEGEDKFDGWTKEAGEGTTFATGGVAEVLNIARGKGNEFDIQQTITDMPNGIYMMALNGLFLAGDDIYSKFYAGQLYLNDTYNYFMVSGEDVIDPDLAEDGVNCLLSDDEEYFDEVEGYVPSTFKGCSYAFSAGRYQNYVATEVTDGTLTVGMRNLGTGLGGDWMPFGNLHLIYLGSATEADDQLTQVLEGYKARAEIILNFDSSSDPSDFAQYPNMSEELRNEIETAIIAADETEDKMALINTFSDLFNKVHANRKAYIDMLDAAYKLSDILGSLDAISMIDDADYEYWDNEIQNAQTAYDEGSLTTEEAIEVTEKLNNCEYTIKPVDGVYQLANVSNLVLFSMIVNSGNSNIKAVLTDDIDLSEAEYFQPIGTAENPFKGEFDGQNHKITGFGTYSEEDDYYTVQLSGEGQGFFGSANGATIKNFSIDGKVEATSGKYIGAIGQAVKCTITNVHSSLYIDVTASGVHHVGGVVGSTEGGSNSTITGCSFSGTLKVAAGSTDNFAGVVGYLGADVVTNCANYGTVIFADAGCAAGGVAGYLNNTNTTIKNCLNVGQVVCVAEGTPKYGGAIVGRIKANWAAEKLTNNYWLEGSAYGPAKKDDGTMPEVASAEGSTERQMRSGEVCFKLNGDQSEIGWYQTINEDQYPVLFATSEQVFFNEEENIYYNLINGIPVGIDEVKSSETKAVQTGIFNLAGQRLDRLQKGINIVNGKKVLVK